MATDKRGIKLYIEKTMIFPIRCATSHPFFFSLFSFLIILYNTFPVLFAFVVSTSPVIVCTSLLLGFLLSYGGPNVDEVKEDYNMTPQVPSHKVDASSSDLNDPMDNFTVKYHEETTRAIEEISVRESLLNKGTSNLLNRTDEAVYLPAELNDKKLMVDSVVAPSSLAHYENSEFQGLEKVMPRKIIVQDCSISKDMETSFLKQTEVHERAMDVNSSPAMKDKHEHFKMDVGQLVVDHNLDSSVDSTWRQVPTYDPLSDSESDQVESSSPDASMTDIIPMLDELKTFRNSEHLEEPLISKDDSDAESHDSLQDQEPESDSSEEEIEKNEEDKDGAHEEKDEGAEVAVKWTEDDTKNVLDVGSSEIERNQRLENLIAKRKAYKNLSFIMERNLIDFDADVSYPSMEELARFRVHVPAVAAPRRNPFDVSTDSEELMVPGSAPSILPGRNPFDYFYDQVENSSTQGEGSDHHETVSFPHRSMWFRRNESFNLGRREYIPHRPSRLKPYFVVESSDSMEGSSTFHRQFSDRSDSKVSTIAESETISSTTDQDYDKELLEKEIDPENELTSFSRHDTVALGQRSQSTVEAGSVNSEQDLEDRDINLEDVLVSDETHQTVETFAGAYAGSRENYLQSTLPYKPNSSFSLESEDTFNDSIKETTEQISTVGDELLVNFPTLSSAGAGASYHVDLFDNKTVYDADTMLTSINLKSSENVENSSSFQKPQICKDMNHEIMHGTESVSVSLPLLPDLLNVALVDVEYTTKMESTDSSSSTLNIKSEPVVQLSDDRPEIECQISAVPNRKVPVSLQSIDSSDEESEVVYPDPEALGNDEFNDNLLADMGEIHTEELTPDHQGPEPTDHQGPEPSIETAERSEDVSIASSSNILDYPQLGSSPEMQHHYIGSRSKEKESEFSPMSGLPDFELEQTVYNPKNQVLQSSIDEDDSLSEQSLEEAMSFSFSESDLYSLMTRSRPPQSRSIADFHSKFKEISEEDETTSID